jgi:L-2,4-diaminobutyric acid acetyltransferase
MTIEVYNQLKNLNISVPNLNDGQSIFELIKRCEPLDLNSSYLYFIQSHFFNNTCAVLKNKSDQIQAFVSGFIKPNDHKTLFIWQVAVDESMRGQGVAIRLIEFILKNNPLITHIETTVTKNNQASRKMFASLSTKLDTQMTEQVFLDKDKHFFNQHESEYLFRIGPITSIR